MLSAQDLFITFNPGTPIETRALRGMSLEIPAGQFVTVIGSNGAGKSTFLNAISGDLGVDTGRIAIDGLDVTRRPVWERAERVARVFQDPMAGTCEDLTIEENMALAQQRGTRRGLRGAVKQAERAMFSSMVRSSQVPAMGSWNTRATRSARSHTGRRVTSRPSMAMRPVSTPRSPEMALRKVDLPAPLEPMTVTNWPAGISSDMPRSARVSMGVPGLKVMKRSCALSMGCSPGRIRPCGWRACA